MSDGPRAAVWRGPRDLRIETREPAAALPSDAVRIAVDWCGVCGSDLLEYTDGPVVIPADGNGGCSLVLGHEFVGTVTTVGAEVTGIGVGDVVGVDTLVRCGRCHYCRSGAFNLCPRLEVIGLTLDGGLAESVDVPAYTCYPLPAGVPRDVAALAEPLAVAVRALRQGRVTPERPLAVIGCGSIGLLCILAARRAGVERVVAVDALASRLDGAGRAGASELGQRLVAPPSDGGPWVILDCTGSPGVVGELARAAPAKSRIVVVSVVRETVELPLRQVVDKELELIGTLSHDASDFRRALELLADPTFDAEWLIGERIALDALPAAVARLAAGDTRLVKLLVSPR